MKGNCVRRMGTGQGEREEAGCMTGCNGTMECVR